MGLKAATVTLGGGSGSGSSGITIGTTTITSGTDTRVLFDDAGTVGESAGLVYAKASGTLTSTVLNASGLTASRLLVTDASKNLASNGALTTNKVPKAVSSGASLSDSQISDDGTTVTVPNISVRTAGAGSSTATLSGVLSVNVTPVTTTDQSEDTLMTYTLPGNTLNADGKSIRIRAQFTSNANANNKTFFLSFGGTKIVTTTANNTGSALCCMEAIVARTGATAQISSSTYLVGANAVAAVQSGVGATTPAETLSGNVVIKGSATNATSGTITQTFMSVELLN